MVFRFPCEKRFISRRDREGFFPPDCTKNGELLSEDEEKVQKSSGFILVLSPLLLCDTGSSANMRKLHTMTK